MSRELTCAERVQTAWESRKADLEIFMNRQDPEEGSEELGPSREYAAGFDYVCPYTWPDQTDGFWRYTISGGGPSEEIRIYGDVINEYKAHMIRAEFWLMDWGDGASVDVSKEACVRWLFEDLTDTGTVSYAYNEGMKNYEGPPEEGEEE